MKSKIIRIEMVQPSPFSPFHHWENPEIVKSHYITYMMEEFRKKIEELKPDEIINIRDNFYERRYIIDIVFKKYDEEN